MLKFFGRDAGPAGRNFAILLALGLTLPGCYSGFGAEYADAGYDSYGCDPYDAYDSYYDCDYGHGFANIGYGGGWYDDYYYPGYGLFIFDRHGKRYQMQHDHRRYWGERRHGWQREHRHGHYAGRDNYRHGGRGNHDDDRSGGWRRGRHGGSGHEATAGHSENGHVSQPPARSERRIRTPGQARQAIIEKREENQARAGAGRRTGEEGRPERRYRNIRNQNDAVTRGTGNRPARATPPARTPAAGAVRNAAPPAARARPVPPPKAPAAATNQNEAPPAAKARPAPPPKPGRREGPRVRGGFRTKVQEQ